MRFVERLDELGTPEAVILPGSKMTLADLAWLRESGLAEKIVTLALGQSLAQGQTLPWPGQVPTQGERVRVVTEGGLVAVAALRRQGAHQVLAPLRVFKHTHLWEDRAGHRSGPAAQANPQAGARTIGKGQTES